MGRKAHRLLSPHGILLGRERGCRSTFLESQEGSRCPRAQKTLQWRPTLEGGGYVVHSMLCLCCVRRPPRGSQGRPLTGLPLYASRTAGKVYNPLPQNAPHSRGPAGIVRQSATLQRRAAAGPWLVSSSILLPPSHIIYDSYCRVYTQVP